MKRYDQVKTKKTDDNQVALKPVLYPTIDRTSDDLYVVTVVGDRLEYIAQQYYGSVSYWWIIAQANGLGKGSTAIEPGTTLRIPTRPSEIAEENRLNNNK